MNEQNVNVTQTAEAAGTASASSESNLADVRQGEGKYYIGEFGGRSRYICFDLNAFAELEERFGSMEQAQERLKKGSMKDIRTVMWLGLVWDEAQVDPATGEPLGYNISEFQVGSWLNTGNLTRVTEVLQNALGGALPEQATPTQFENAVNSGDAVAQAITNPN